MKNDLSLARQLIQKSLKTKDPYLELGNCGITDLNDLPELFECTHLETLILSNEWVDYEKRKWIESENSGVRNELDTIPENLGKLVSLKKLVCGGGYGEKWKISDISFIKNLTNLKTLDLGGNQISDILFIKNLTNIQTLDLSENKISDILFIKNLTNIQTLDLSGNQISDISFIKNLTNLKTLYLSGNQISDISFIKNLTNLETLYLSGNQISDISPLILILKKGIPISLSTYLNKKSINLTNNPLPPALVSAIEEGNEAVIRYLERQQSKTNRFWEAKIVMVGQPGAGKTSLTKKLIDNTHQVIPGKNVSTIGINIEEGWEFETKVKNETQELTANFWDMGGQEIQYMTHQYFITPRSLYVLVCNDRKENTRFGYWFDIIKLLGKNPYAPDSPYSPVLVVQNEFENSQNSNFSIYQYCDQYPNLRIEQIKVDLSNDTDGRFEKVQRKIQEKFSELPHLGEKLPVSWIEVRKAIQELKNEGKKHISWDKFQAICVENEIEGYDNCADLSRYLHDIGIILHFLPKNEEFAEDTLHDFVILDVKWALEAVYLILKNEKIRDEQNGFFTQKDIKELWKKSKLSQKEQTNLVNLMRKDSFEICFETNERRKRFLAPSLIQNIRPYFEWRSEQALKFQILYKNRRPYGIASRVFVRLNDMIKKGKNGKYEIWKDGGLFEENGCVAQLMETETDKGGKIISIEVVGDESQKKFLMYKLRQEVYAIHRKSFPGIEIEERVPCNCVECVNKKDPHFFEVNVLYRYLQNGINAIRCDVSVIIEVPIFDLLGGIYDVKETRQNVDVHFIGEDNLRYSRQTFDFDEIKKNIANNKVSEAIDELINITKIMGENSICDDVIGLSRRFKSIQNQNANGTIKTDDFQLECSKITKSLLGYISELEGR